MARPRLRQFASNATSQCGEDGIIAELFDRIGAADPWVVEFGAWDGEVASNSSALIAAGWSAVLIEGDERRFSSLERRYANRDDVVTVHAMVGWQGDSTLDKLLAATPIPDEFDLLIIDIDGNDYHVWAAMTAYRPRAVVIEFNPTIPNGVVFVQPADPRVNQGASIDTLVALGRDKGYELVEATQFNAFFVRADLFEAVGIGDNTVLALRTDTSWQSQIFFGYDGRAFIQGGRGLYWHGVPVPTQVRVVPRMLQGFPGTFGRGRRAVLLIWRIWRHARARVRRS